MINSTTFLKSPLVVTLQNGKEVAYKSANIAVAIKDGHLYVGDVVGTHNGNVFNAQSCYAAGAWVSVCEASQSA